MRNYAIVSIVLLSASLAASAAQADFVTSLGVTSNLLEPVGWNVGDPLSTHQIWDRKTSASGSLPDRGYNVAGGALSSPIHSVNPPGFLTGSGNFYSFTGNYGAVANIYNHAVAPAGMGTHVIVQMGHTVNPDEESFPGHGTGTLLDSLQIVDLSNSALTGGTNGEALQIAEVLYQSNVSTSFGLVDYQELIFEFWLPGYTGNFRVDFDQKVHSTIDTLRVDSMIAPEAPGGGSPFLSTAVPEPSGLALGGMAAFASAAFVSLRRRRNRR